jgi:hypothetical protein
MAYVAAPDFESDVRLESPTDTARRRSFVTPHVINLAPAAKPWNVIGNAGEAPGGRSFDCLYLLQCCVLQISLTHPAENRLIIGQKSLISLEIKFFSEF